jgi:hypothetical protein
MEMLLLKELDLEDEAKVRAYRLQVKARLYRFNYVRAERARLCDTDNATGNAIDHDCRGTKSCPGADV